MTIPARISMAALALVALVALVAGGPAAAQIGGVPGKKGAPVQIEADKGIEWRQAKKVYIARGNAKVTRGNITVKAEVLTAHYRGKPGQAKTKKGGAPTRAGTDIWQITAVGNVVITQGDRTISGGHGVYNLDSGVFRLTGGNILMESKSETITANGKLEYRSKDKIAIVEGNAIATKDDKKVRADRFTAYFADGPDGKVEVQRIVAEGNVIITTPTEVARANKGIYNHKTGLAVLIGSVKLTRGDSQLNGDRAEVNLKTGVSRLLASRSGRGRGRVRGLFIPGGDTGGPVPKGGGAIIPGARGAPKPAPKKK